LRHHFGQLGNLKGHFHYLMPAFICVTRDSYFIDRKIKAMFGSSNPDLTHAFKVPGLVQQDAQFPVDYHVLMSRCMGNVAFALELLDELEINCPNQVDSVKTFVASDNCDGAADVAHSLKGAASIIGAEPLRRIAADVELAGRANDLARLVELAEDLKKEMDRCVNFVPKLRSKLRDGSMSLE